MAESTTQNTSNSDSEVLNSRTGGTSTNSEFSDSGCRVAPIGNQLRPAIRAAKIASGVSTEFRIEPIGNQLTPAFDAANKAKMANEVGLTSYLHRLDDDAKLQPYLKKRRDALIDLANTIDASMIDSAIRTLAQLLSSFELASNEAKSIYADRLNGESAYDYIIRTNPDYPRYQGKRKDGDIIDWLRVNYRDTGYIDGLLFTRASLRKLDKKASQGLDDWSRSNKILPSDLNIPLKKGQAAALVARFTPEEINAATSIKIRSYS